MSASFHDERMSSTCRCSQISAREKIPSLRLGLRRGNSSMDDGSRWVVARSQLRYPFTVLRFDYVHDSLIKWLYNGCIVWGDVDGPNVRYGHNLRWEKIGTQSIAKDKGQGVDSK